MSFNSLSTEDIANSLYFSTHCILELTTSFITTTEEVQQRYSVGIRTQLKDLFKDLNQYEVDDNRQLQDALQFKFTSKIYKDEQSLNILIASLFMMALGIERKFNYTLFESDAQLDYARDLISMYHDSLKDLIK